MARILYIYLYTRSKKKKDNNTHNKMISSNIDDINTIDSNAYSGELSL